MANHLSAIGLMSGTSLDGMDVAHILTDGEGRVERRGFMSFPYDDAQRARLRAGLEAAKSITARHERPGELAALESDLTHWHAEAVARFRAEMRVGEVDVIGFHGQTVLHRPDARLTVQLGDGGLLARETGLPVVADMRAADVAAGGQGAPLVPIYHAALAGELAARPCAFVNVGGVANITWVGPAGELLAFDTGPGNALLDDWALKHTGRAVDADGQLAAAGTPDETRLTEWLAEPWFSDLPPKSLDRLSFARCTAEGLSPEDGAATLAAFTARSIAASMKHLPAQPAMWLIAGGGRRNPVLMQMLRAAIPAMVVSAEDAGLDGDAMEAEAWAYLAVRSLRGLALTFPGTTRAPQAMRGGVLFTP